MLATGGALTLSDSSGSWHCSEYPSQTNLSSLPGELAERIGLQRMLTVGVCQLVGAVGAIVAAAAGGLGAVQHIVTSDQRDCAGRGYADHE